MTWEKGPWDREPEAAPQTVRRPFRLGLWIGVLVAAGLAAWALFRLFPGAVASGEDWSRVVYLLLALAVVSAGLLRARRITLGRMAGYVAIWVGVLAVLVLGYSYRGELGDVATRVRSAFAPGYAVSARPHEMVVSQDDQDNYVVIGQVNGQPVRFTVDTGASDIVLSPADARRLGVDVAQLTYPIQVQTANGPGRSAPYTAQSLAIGDLRFSDVSMEIDSKPMPTSLLGMAFLNRLESYQVKGRRLYLKGRDQVP